MKEDKNSGSHELQLPGLQEQSASYTFPSQVAVRPARGDIRPGDTTERIFYPSLVKILIGSVKVQQVFEAFRNCQQDNLGGFLYRRNIFGLIFCEPR